MTELSTSYPRHYFRKSGVCVNQQKERTPLKSHPPRKTGMLILLDWHIQHLYSIRSSKLQISRKTKAFYKPFKPTFVCRKKKKWPGFKKITSFKRSVVNTKIQMTKYYTNKKPSHQLATLPLTLSEFLRALVPESQDSSSLQTQTRSHVTTANHHW